MSFRDLSASIDQAVLDATGDDALLDGAPVRILFCEPWLEPRIGTLRTDITQPMAFLPADDIAGLLENAVLTFSGLDYDVVGRELDGTGWVGLVLRER